MSDVIKIGPPWGTVVDSRSKVVKHHLRPVCRFDEVKQLRMVEYFNPAEEEQLLNANPDVQKLPRNAQLFADTKDGRKVLIGELDQAGLLLDHATRIALAMGGIPLLSERHPIA